jgi:hypothetical protein
MHGAAPGKTSSDLAAIPVPGLGEYPCSRLGLLAVAVDVENEDQEKRKPSLERAKTIKGRSRF